MGVMGVSKIHQARAADSLFGDPPASPNPYVYAGADISPDGRYRYRLWREWRGCASRDHWRWLGAKDGAGHELGEPLSVLFVMLNPSTADGTTDDPTIRRCVGFAKRWRYDRLEVVNLFAHRANCWRWATWMSPTGRATKR
jgi:hypothetical protein